MPRFVTATVTEVLAERRGLQRVATDDGRAYVLTDLVGPVAVGDRVVLNTTAVDLGLGTGGWHVVHWNLARDAWSQPGPGHIMKLRYTSLQVDTGAAEEAPPRPARRRSAACRSWRARCTARWRWWRRSLRHLRPDARIAYVMTDGAALPLALSDLVHELRDAGRARRHHHRRPRLRRRPRGGVGAVGAGAGPPRRRRRRRGRGHGPGRRGHRPRRWARPRSRWPASSTPPRAGGPGGACAAGCRGPIPRPATRA